VIPAKVGWKFCVEGFPEMENKILILVDYCQDDEVPIPHPGARK